jgi:DNA polymerase delta subunit 1
MLYLAGIETVRRDNCLLVKNVVTECLHKILIERNVQGAIQYVKSTIADLLMNRMDLSLLVITKVLIYMKHVPSRMSTFQKSYFKAQKHVLMSALCKQGLTKTGDDYAVKAAHVELAERMRKVK